ncbi:IS3 family transposase [Fusobacterium sp.]
MEKYYLKKYRKLEELEKAISSYVKFYNEERLQKNLRERSPLEYRKLNK